MQLTQWWIAHRGLVYGHLAGGISACIFGAALTGQTDLLFANLAVYTALIVSYFTSRP